MSIDFLRAYKKAKGKSSYSAHVFGYNRGRVINSYDSSWNHNRRRYYAARRKYSYKRRDPFVDFW